MIGNVVVLDNNEKYIVTSECEYKGENYLLLAKVKEDESIADDMTIAKHIGSSIEIVEDIDTFKEVLNRFDID